MSSESVLWGLVIAALIAVGLLTLLVIGLLRSYGEIVKVLHDARIRVDDDSRADNITMPAKATSSNGSQARPVSGETLSGGAKAITVTGSDDILLLAFLSSGCGSCIEFWRTLRAKKGRLPGLDAKVVVVTKGPAREEPARLSELAGDRVEVLMSDESWDAYDVPLTPHFVLVDRSRGVIIGEGSSADPDSLAGLMARAAADANNVTRRELITRKKGNT